MKLETRFRILNAARSMVGELGVERVTMRGIAARANITAPAIYKHFRNKRHLLDEVIATGYTELGLAMNLGEDLEDMLRQVLVFADAQPNLTRMMLAPHTDDHLPIRKLQRHFQQLRKPNPRWNAQVLWAQLRGQLTMRAPPQLLAA